MFISCNTYFTLVGNVDNGGGIVGAAVHEKCLYRLLNYALKSKLL